MPETWATKLYDASVRNALEVNPYMDTTGTIRSMPEFLEGVGSIWAAITATNNGVTLENTNPFTQRSMMGNEVIDERIKIGATVATASVGLLENIEIAIGNSLRSASAELFGDTIGQRIVSSDPLSNPQNIANGPRLSQQLTMQSAESSFNVDGTLTQEAIDNSRMTHAPGSLSNPAIPDGYGKYTTETFQSPYGNFQTHFYMNPDTGDVYYGLDYKSVFNNMSGVQSPYNKLLGAPK